MRRESISQAGRRLVRVLGTTEFMGLPPDTFFTKCYTLRSRLVHGYHPRPDVEDIEGHAPELERMVSSLLTAPLRGSSGSFEQ
jgi:hypothetical protein